MCRRPWLWRSSSFWRARFGKRFKATLGNGDILFWMISQRILPPIVVIIPVYMMFQAVGLLDTHLALIIVYAVANLPIVVWLMHDFFASLPIELEESAQLDGSTRFGIFWEIVLPLTRPGPCRHHAADADPQLERISLRGLPLDLQGPDHADHGCRQERRREGHSCGGRCAPSSWS